MHTIVWITWLIDRQPIDILVMTNILESHRIVVKCSRSLGPTITIHYSYLPPDNRITRDHYALTSISRWKSNKSIFCQLDPSNARIFQYLLTYRFEKWENFINLSGHSKRLSCLRRNILMIPVYYLCAST